VESPKVLELLELGKKAVNSALKCGADEAEAFLSVNSGVSINIERGQIVRCTKSSDDGLGVRAVYSKAVGFSYTNTLTDKEIQQTAARALKAAKASRPDKDWVCFADANKLPQLRGMFDKRIVDLSSDTLVEMASELLGSVVAYDKRVLGVDGGVGTSVFGNVCVNSRGVEAAEEGTAVGCSMETIARDGADVTPACFESDAKRMFTVDPVVVGTEAARQAASCLGARRISSGVFPVVFTQAAFRSLLTYTVVNAIKADFVLRERSAFKDKVGQKVASELVSVCDDGLLEGGLGSRNFDGEGVPSQKTVVIKDGVLRNFLYDNYTARKANAQNTGNASRSGGGAYSSTPTLDASNFVFGAGNKTDDELLAEVKDGLIVYGVQGAHSSNAESGEFSVVATPAWKIKDGSVAGAVRDVMLTGSFFDVLSNVSGLGKDVRQVGQLVAPWIRAENVRVIGRL
jgi:PmbA protein